MSVQDKSLTVSLLGYLVALLVDQSGRTGKATQGQAGIDLDSMRFHGSQLAGLEKKKRIPHGTMISPGAAWLVSFSVGAGIL